MPYGYGQLFEETASAVTATPSVTLGQRQHYNSVDYVYCYNAGNSQINPGYGVVCSANSAYSVTLTSVIGDLPFGVVVNATATTGTYFWAAQRGIVKLVTADNASASAQGQAFFLDANGTWRHAATGATGSTWAYAARAVGLEGIATASSGKVFLSI